MTTNQLQFQRNLIAADEAAVKSRSAEIEALRQAEQARANRQSEYYRAKELAQDLAIAEKKLEQAERENVAKYGTATYATPGEERGGIREMSNLPYDYFRQIMSAFNPLAAIFKGR